MIRFIRSNFILGDSINIYCNDGSLLTGKLLEIRDEDIVIKDRSGVTLVMKYNVSDPIYFYNSNPQDSGQGNNENIIDQMSTNSASFNDANDQKPKQEIKEVILSEQMPMGETPSTKYSVLRNYTRFNNGKLLPDGIIVRRKPDKNKKYVLVNLSDNKEYSFFSADVIDKDILASMKRSNFIIQDYLNYIIGSDGKVCCLHNMSLTSLLRLVGSQEDKRHIVMKYVKHKLETMMPGGDKIEIDLDKKKVVLSDEDRCRYLLSLLNSVIGNKELNIDNKFNVFLLDLNVKVVEKLLELHSKEVDGEYLERTLVCYLETCIKLKNQINLSTIELGKRFTRLAEIQLQLGRPRETIIQNAIKACEFSSDSQEALDIKGKAEKLPRDVWHDNRDIKIFDGESAVSGIEWGEYKMDQKRVNGFLIDMKLADQITSNRIVDSIRDYHWTKLADDSVDDEKKKEAIDGYLRLSLGPQSSDSGIDLLNKAIRSDDILRREAAWYALICIGTASMKAWNLLLDCKEDMFIFFEDEKKLQTYNLLNKVSGLILDTDLPSYKFLRTIFLQRREQIKKILQMKPKLFIEEIRYFDDIIECLNEMRRFKIFNATENNDILAKIFEISNGLKSYESYDDDERIIRLNEAADQLIPIINLIRNYPTFFGTVLFCSPLENWQNKIKVAHTKKKSLRQPKFSVYASPAYIQKQDKGGYYESFFSICIENVGQQSADGYKLDITLTPEDDNYEEMRLSDTAKTIKVGAGNKDSMRVKIPTNMQGAKVINASIDTEAFFCERWLPPVNSRFTLYVNSETSDSYIKGQDEILFNISQPSNDTVFKGRECEMKVLKRHYLSKNRNEIFILYGLSRTGKTSMAQHLMKDLKGESLTYNDGRHLIVLPFSWPIDEISSITNKESLWSFLIKDSILIPLFENKDDYKEKYNINLDFERLTKKEYNSTDFSFILHTLNKAGIYPFFVLDEFQYMKKLIKHQGMSNEAGLSEAFIHSIRQKANEGLASFLFAGTYEIKDLIRDPIYGLNQGQFVTTKEKMIYNIKPVYAEELMSVMGDKLQFTREAIQYIHKLSYDVPFFVQMICKACADFALVNHRNYIGYPELNHVICCLTGENLGTEDGIVRIPEGSFTGNMLDTSHPMEEDVLRYITLYNRERPIDPRPVGYNYIKEQWKKEFPDRTESDLRGTLDLLIEKEVIKDTNDREYNQITYSINVDLFRRWFTFKEKRINN